MEAWKLTDQEIAELVTRGGSVYEAREAKKQAYIDNGGVILNPDALEDMYEALKAINKYLETGYPKNMRLKEIAIVLLDKALAKAEGK